MWLRHVESPRDDEEEMVQVCELEVGRNLINIEDELRSAEDLNDYHVCIDFQEGRTKNSNYQVGNEMGSEDLIDC
jgi:hypothetical protein